MPDKMIKKLSRQLNHGLYLRSISIPIIRMVSVLFFCALPWLISLILRDSGLCDTMQSVNPMLPVICFTIVFGIIIIQAGMTYSSFSLGEKAWYTGRLTRKKLCGKRLRFWFAPSHSLKALRLRVMIFLLKILWMLAFLSPALLLYSAIVGTAVTGGIEFYLFLSLFIGGTVLLLIGLVFSFIIAQRYYLAPYLMANNPKLSPVQTIKQSKNLLDGHLLRIVKFKLKFIPSFMLYPFIFPIIFFHPHYKQSCSVLAKEICL